MAAIPQAAAIPTMFHFFMILLRVSLRRRFFAFRPFAVLSAARQRPQHFGYRQTGMTCRHPTLPFRSSTIGSERRKCVFGIML
jgi:hypothetical protein